MPRFYPQVQLDDKESVSYGELTNLIYNVGYWLVWCPPAPPPPQTIWVYYILFHVQISWVPGVNNKKSLDKKGFQLKSIYGQLISF